MSPSNNLVGLGRFTVSPKASSKYYLSHVDGCCDDAQTLLVCRVGDEYEIDAYLMSCEEHASFSDEYSKIKSDAQWRLLRLRELLSVNILLKTQPLRSIGFPIIGEDFVLDYDTMKIGHDTDNDEDCWVVRPATVYHGFVLHKEARFALTKKTLVDKGVWDYRLIESWLNSHPA